MTLANLLTRSTTAIRISDLLARAANPGVQVPDAHTLERCRDTVLYVAERNVQYRSLAAFGSPNYAEWHADSVTYLGGVLPNGEPHRSIGHWNGPSQIEIFQVQTGSVTMAVIAPDNEWVSVADYGRGQMCIIPPGAFHITYCTEPVACVFNIYADPGHSGRDKYEGAPPPTFDLSQRNVAVPVPPGVRLPADLSTLLLGEDSSALARIASDIVQAGASGWPR